MARTSFPAALRHVLAEEGGYVDHPADPGGATHRGITQATLADWRGYAVTKAEVRALTVAEAGEIYRARYWNAARGDDLPAGLDLALFDFAVNSGPSRAVRTLQACLGVAVDGRIGPQTRAAIANRKADDLIRRLCAERLAFLERLKTYPVFGRGWSRRVRRIEAAALSLTTHFPHENKENSPMLDTKSILESRTIWANVIGLLALVASVFGLETGGLDAGKLTDSVLQVIAAGGFILSSIFRVTATRRLG